PADGCQSNAQAEDKGGDQVEVVVDLQVTQGQVEYGYQQRHAGVQLLAQYHGGAVTEDVAQDAAEDPRGHAGHDHHRGGVAQLQRDIAADHGEGDKTHGIQYQEDGVQAVHVTRHQHGQQPGRNGQMNVHGVLGPGHRIVAQQHVADGTAAQCGDEGDEADAEHVHVTPSRGERAGHGFGGNGDQIDVEKHTGVLELCRLSPCPFT